MSRFRARPRKNGYDIDIKAPDGFLLGGWRRICRGGFVRFHGSRWRHPDMIGREGEYVFLHVDCHMACDASFAFEDEPRRYWTPPTNIEGRGRRAMVCDDASEDVRLAQDAAGWYSQAQMEEIERKESVA